MAELNLQSPQMMAHQQVYGDANGLNQLKQIAREDQAEALRPVAEQFEALFLSQILKESRNVKFDDGWLDGNHADFYKDWHDSQLSQSISSKGSIGLADKIVEQLAPSLQNVSKSFNQMGIIGTESTTQPQKIQQRQPDSSVVTTAESLALRQFK